MSVLWRHHPNGGRVGSVSVARDVAPGLVDQGWIRLDGERAAVGGTTDEAKANRTELLLVFDRPYPHPHP